MHRSLAVSDKDRARQIVSAKRSTIERQGIHAWHPYYAGYSEAFVESAIGFLGADESSLILDPWGGSGTTGIVAARSGVPSLCLDINPAIATFAAAKSSSVLAEETKIRDFFARLTSAKQKPTSRKGRGLGTTESTSRFSESTGYVQALIGTMREFSTQFDHLASPSGIVQRALVSGATVKNPIQSFAMAVLFVTLRNLSGPKRLTNPTWVKTSEVQVQLPWRDVTLALERNAGQMLWDLRAFYQIHRTDLLNHVLVGDVRAMPLVDGSIDYVVTSPPYLTRIDYAISTSPELALLGEDGLTESIRHNTMGAPVITKSNKAQEFIWGGKCNQLLDDIADHGTKAARSYYWKNIVQYFMDMEAGLREIHRALRRNGEALVVVQSSYFKEIEMPLGEIYVEMARNLGFGAQVAFREEVKGHMAHVNTKSNKYAKNKVYFEDVVHLKKSCAS